MTANVIVLREIKHQSMGNRTIKGGILETRMLQVLDNLFIEAYYGPACVAARSTLEFILQNDCLDSTKVPTTFKKRIDDPNTRNPGIYDLLKELQKTNEWSKVDDEPSIKIIVDNGDWNVHHRIPQITQGKPAQAYPLGMTNVVPTYNGLKIIPLPDRWTYEMNRGNEELRMAKESIGELNKILDGHRC